MTVTVTVDATWRMAHIDISRINGLIMGHSEILLQEPAEPSPGADILRRPKQFGGAETKIYGAMRSAVMTRSIEIVANETVELDDNTVISFAATIEALNKFFEKWRVEDAAKPIPESVATTAIPPPLPVAEVDVAPPPLVATPHK